MMHIYILLALLLSGSSLQSLSFGDQTEGMLDLVHFVNLPLLC